MYIQCMGLLSCTKGQDNDGAHPPPYMVLYIVIRFYRRSIHAIVKPILT